MKFFCAMDECVNEIDETEYFYNLKYENYVSALLCEECKKKFQKNYDQHNIMTQNQL